MIIMVSLLVVDGDDNCGDYEYYGDYWDDCYGFWGNFNDGYYRDYKFVEVIVELV